MNSGVDTTHPYLGTGRGSVPNPNYIKPPPPVGGPAPPRYLGTGRGSIENPAYTEWKARQTGQLAPSGQHQVGPTDEERWSRNREHGLPTGYGPHQVGNTPEQEWQRNRNHPGHNAYTDSNGTYHAAGPANPERTDPHEDAAADPNQVGIDNQYVEQFNASMARQRAAIDAALVTSLTQLGARRDAASKVVAGIPQQIKDTYNQTDTKQSGIMNAATKATGPRGAPGGDANAALYANDNEASKKSGLSVQPLLQAGVQSNYDLGEAGLNQEHLAGLSQLASQEAQFNAGMAAAEQSHNYSVEDRQYLIDHPEADPNNKITPYQQAQLDAAEQDRKDRLNAANDDKLNSAEATATGEGYTSAAGKAKGESIAKHWTGGTEHLDLDTLKRMYDYDTLLALAKYHIISQDDFYKATGTQKSK